MSIQCLTQSIFEKSYLSPVLISSLFFAVTKKAGGGLDENLMQKLTTSLLDALTKSLPKPVPVSPAFCLLLPDFPYIGALPASGAHSMTPAPAAFQPSLSVCPAGSHWPQMPWRPALTCPVLAPAPLPEAFSLLLPMTVFFFSLHQPQLGSWAPALAPWWMGEMGSQGLRG